MTFVSGAEIYVGAGRREGLLDGAELYVVRRDSVVSTLRVKFLSSHQASCEVIQGASDIVVGDVVRFVPSLSVPGTGTMAMADRPRRPRRLSGPGIHGRLGLRHLRGTSGISTDSSTVQTGGTAFNQPSFDLRLAGLSIGGTPMGLAVDLRTRRTATTSTGQASSVDGRTRVYQMAVFWGAPGAPLRTVAGRQYLAAVTSVGMFDGGLVEVNRSHVTLGVFGGLEPDAANLGFSRAIQDHGAYVQVHNRPGTPSSWFLTTGAVRSFQAGSANREFGFMQASASSSRFSFYGLQEVDYYPSWKVQLGEKQFSFTSQYASGLYRPSHWLSFNGTYDNRRSVRLYRDTQNPETSFDDAYRQGYGGGVQLTARKAYVGGDWRRSTGGTAGAADSYTGTLGLDRFTPLKLGFSARATWYQNQNDSASSPAPADPGTTLRRAAGLRSGGSCCISTSTEASDASTIPAAPCYSNRRGSAWTWMRAWPAPGLCRFPDCDRRTLPTRAPSPRPRCTPVSRGASRPRVRSLPDLLPCHGVFPSVPVPHDSARSHLSFAPALPTRITILMDLVGYGSAAQYATNRL